MKSNKLYYSICLILLLLLAINFFYKTIPVPVENIDGSRNPDKYVFGGFYYTSISELLHFKEYYGSGLYGFIIFFLFIENHLLFKQPKKRRTKKWDGIAE